MRYRKPAVEVEAIQWTGGNLEALQNRFGAEMIRPVHNPDHDFNIDDAGLLELTTDAGSGECCYVRIGEWVIGERIESGWQLNRIHPDRFAAEGYRVAYPDRTRNYVPEDLYLDGRPQYAEVSPARIINPQVLRRLVDVAASLLTGSWARFEDVANQGGTRYDTAPIREWLAMLDDYTDPDQEHPAQYARITHGSPDEHNRDSGHWWWADMSAPGLPEGSHWSHFNGHRMQVDVELHTVNRHDVHEWKGRDEIRAGGHWTLHLNRQPMGDGHIGGTDLRPTLQRIEQLIGKLADHSALNHSSDAPYAEQLAGRRVYYQRHPAVVSGDVLSQGCVILSPVGDPFPKAVYDFDAEGTENDLSDPYERSTVKVELDSPEIWWHRRRCFGDEQPVDRRTRLVEVAGTPQEGAGGFGPLPPADGPGEVAEERTSAPVEADDEDKESGS